MVCVVAAALGRFCRLRSDRRMMQILLLVTCFFFFNVAHLLWRFSDGSAAKATSSFEESGRPHDPPAATKKGHNDDLYGESIFCVNNNNNNYNDRPVLQHPIFLWGIPSTMADKEVERRKLLRSTYLNFYRDFRPPPPASPSAAAAGATSSSTPTTTAVPPHEYEHEPDRICSLQEWTCRYDELRHKCQLIYVFFVGGAGGGNNNNNETTAAAAAAAAAPPSMLDESLDDFRQMLVPTIPPLLVPAFGGTSANGGGNSSPLMEPGIAYLNIRENQFDGKMTTWFQFAALVGKEYPEIDYAAKVDSDLLLLTPNFFDYIGQQHNAILDQRRKEEANQHQQQQQQQQQQKHQQTVAPAITRVYGGVEFPDTNCEPNMTFDHPCPLPLVGRSYMSGELNFMSMDLARYIASDDCPRDSLTIPHEDVSLSNYVYSYTTNHAYHQRRTGNIGGNDRNTTVDIVSVNTTQILITTNTLADWHTVNLRKQPELFRHVLWGHSIKRGKYKRYLVWKEDRSFLQFWNQFMTAYARRWTGEPTTHIGGTNNNVAATTSFKNSIFGRSTTGNNGTHAITRTKLDNKKGGN